MGQGDSKPKDNEEQKKQEKLPERQKLNSNIDVKVSLKRRIGEL